MFSGGKTTKEYSHISLDDFSDDDSSTDSSSSNQHNYATTITRTKHNARPNNSTHSSGNNIGGYIDDPNNNNNNNDATNEDYMRNQQVLMQQQDVGLDVLSQSVMRLGEMSTAIGEELGQQNKMLESMETELDTAADELDIVTRSTKKLIEKSGGMSSFCVIAALSIVVFVLLFLILYV